VWLWLHYTARAHASNALGKLLVGDWVADAQIQRAIKQLSEMEPRGGEVKLEPRYAWVLAKDFPLPRRTVRKR